MRKTHNIEIKIILPMDFPNDWDKEMIDFHLNESSWCCNNLIELLQEYAEKNECICSITTCQALD